MTKNENWGGNRKGAGRVAAVKRTYCHYYLSKEENEIELEVTSAFKKVEAQINRDLAKELKCKQYEIADIVYKKILAHRKTLMDQVIKDINKVDLIKEIKEEIIKERQS